MTSFNLLSEIHREMLLYIGLKASTGNWTHSPLNYRLLRYNVLVLGTGTHLQEGIYGLYQNGIFYLFWKLLYMTIYKIIFLKLVPFYLAIERALCVATCSLFDFSLVLFLLRKICDCISYFSFCRIRLPLWMHLFLRI